MRALFRSRYFRLFEVWVAFWVLGSAYFHDILGVRFHGDESQWISTSYFFEAFLAGYPGPGWPEDDGLPPDFEAPDWVLRALDPGIGAAGAWSVCYWTLTQPPMTRYMIAVGRLLGGYSTVSLNGPWDFQVSYAENSATGRMPSPGLLRSARATMAFLAIISGLILFLLVRQCAGPFAAYAFLILFAGSDFLLLHLRRAMSESPLLFWTSLALMFGSRTLAGLRLSETAGSRRLPLLWLLLMGAASGLAGAVKLNGLALAATSAATGCAVVWKRRKASGPWPVRWGVVLWVVPLLFLVTVFVFTAINPFLYPSPPVRMYGMLLFRAWEMAEQSQNSQWLIPDFKTRLRLVPWRILTDYTLLKLQLINVPLMCLGIYALVRSAWLWLADDRRSPATVRVSATSLVVLLGAAVTAILPLFTPLDWDRYYLYPVIFVSIFIAAGIGQIARWIRAAAEYLVW